MKTALRVCGLTLALIAAFYSPASAYWVTCYYMCDDGFRTTASSYQECCGGTGYFPCPGGGQGSPYGYDDGWGPQFC